MLKHKNLDNDLTNDVVEERNLVVMETSDFQLQKIETMKKGLKRYFNKRKKDFIAEFQQYCEENTMDGNLIPVIDKVPMHKIIEHTFAPIIKVAGMSPTYSADEMAIGFDFYIKCCEKLNELSYYVPKIEDFCRMMNISRNTFDRYQTSHSEENMRETCNKIQDYCVARATDGAFASKDKAVVTYTMFHQKSSNKQQDNPPVQNNTYIQNNTIMSNEDFNELASKYSN